jgi:hypothetical protein
LGRKNSVDCNTTSEKAYQRPEPALKWLKAQLQQPINAAFLRLLKYTFSYCPVMNEKQGAGE